MVKYGFHVGKYTIYMDCLGKGKYMHLGRLTAGT